MTQERQLPLVASEAQKTGKQPKARKAKRANDLDGRTWERFSISVWSNIRKTPEELKLGHPAMFPLELMIRLIQCFTSSEDKVVFDPFAGIGSTPIAAESMGKVGIGIELSREFCQKAERRQIAVGPRFDEGGEIKGKMLNDLLLPAEPGERRIHADDARNLLKYVSPGSVDLVITSPPYWDILLQERSADQKEIRHYGEEEADLGKISGYNQFLEAMKEIFAEVYEALKPGKYCVVIVMDLRKKAKFYPFHADVANMMQSLGFIYDDLIIWDRRHEYNNMRPLGYPYKFRINKAHEFILIFQKPGKENSE